MQSSIEHIDEGQIRITVTVPAADVDREIDAAYSRIGSKLRIPGFRPGKAPRPVIDTHVGRDAVLAEAQEDIVSTSYGAAISEQGVRTYGQPDVGELDMVEPGADFTYTAEVHLRPELPLTDSEDFAVTVPARSASDREVDAQIERARERFATLEVVERPIETNDFALISFVGTVDGEEYEGNKVDKYLYELGRGMMPPEFDEALLGVAPGGSAVAEFVIPDTSSNEEFVGKTAHFDIEVHEVKAKILPALDDEFAASVGGFDSFEEYRTDVREKLDSAKATGFDHKVEVESLRTLVERLDGEVPDEMVLSRAASMTREFFESLEDRGISLQQYVEATGAEPTQIQADLKVQAAVRVAEELALESLFRARGFEVADTDLDEAILELVNGDEIEARQMRESLAANGALPILREQIMHRRALAWLMENTVVTEEEPS
ncbi:MAG: trigger factor [Coriobacteriia bacterium]|nr:trigger factor [Coriobacteriia bacterium]